MRKHLFGLSKILMLSWCLLSCRETVRQTAHPTPESQQVVRESMKDLYMAASAAAPRSLEQQKMILRMADKAANGKELLLVMRAGMGVFPAAADAPDPSAEARLHAIVTSKMIAVGTLDQLIEYTAQYMVDAGQARAYIQRMFQLGENASDARSWLRIRAAASRLKLTDMAQQAQARAERLSGQ